MHLYHRVNTESDSPVRWRLLAIALLTLGALCLLMFGSLVVRDRFLTRGIPPGLPDPISQGGARLGMNVYLQDSTEAEVAAALDDIRAHGITYVKQPFSYTLDFDWEAAERLVAAAAARSLTIVPLLDGDPTDGFAPPEDFAAYAAWAGEFAARYGDRVDHYIIWDEPNLASHWGGQSVNPGDYAALLAAAAAAIRAQDPGAVIVAAPLAPTTETGPTNLSETLFLQGLYEAGAAEAFDVVALKPYGFDTGPDDRRVAEDTLNFSRPILIRELMNSLGDAGTAI